MKPQGMEAIRVGAAVMRAVRDLSMVAYLTGTQKQVPKKVRRSTAIPEGYNSSGKTGVGNA